MSTQPTQQEPIRHIHVVTQDELVRTAPERFLKYHQNLLSAGSPLDPNDPEELVATQPAGEISDIVRHRHEALVYLQNKNQLTADDVVEITGETRWTDLTCDCCQQPQTVVASLSEANDHVCPQCLAAAQLALLEAQNNQLLDSHQATSAQ